MRPTLLDAGSSLRGEESRERHNEQDTEAAPQNDGHGDPVHLPFHEAPPRSLSAGKSVPLGRPHRLQRMIPGGNLRKKIVARRNRRVRRSRGTHW